MSLHHLAQQVRSKGRGEDTQLVHMTPKEVQGLQKLAVEHGGSLTINPHTGLPEAGFLSALLPTLLGVGLAPFTGGLSAALLVGGGYAAATGSLKKGLMAGLGAYGGAGLGGSLSALGAEAAGAGAGAGASALPGAATMAGEAAAPAALASGAPATAAYSAFPATIPPVELGAVPPVPGMQTAGVFSNPAYPSAIAPAATQTATQTAATLNPTLAETLRNTNAAVSGSPAMSYGTNLQGISATPQSLPATAAQPVTYGGMGRGLEQLNSMDKLKAFASGNTMNLAAAGAPMLAPPPFKPLKPDEGMIRPYTLEREQNPYAYAEGVDEQGRTNTPVYGQPFDSSERNYFTDTYTALEPYKAPGPEYKASETQNKAVGGPVEEMAAQNSLSGNTMYPQANLDVPMYSNSQTQRPISGNVVGTVGDTSVDPYTGEQKFARGGTTGTYDYDYDPKTQQFTQTAAPVEAPPLVSSSVLIGPYNTATVYRPRVASPAPASATPIVSGGIRAPVQSYTPATQQQYKNYAQASPQTQQVQQPDDMASFYDYMRNQMGGMQGYAGGGDVSNLGDYSDGGHLLRGPGDGVSDSIPAVIGKKQPARLADGEFVIPARIVSELGNGSTDAGAKQLYAMMDRVQKARGKTVGKNQVAKNTKSNKLMPV